MYINILECLRTKSTCVESGEPIGTERIRYGMSLVAERAIARTRGEVSHLSDTS